MDDMQCLDNARGQCDKDPDCYGVSWYPHDVGQKIKLCLSRDMAPKNDGWRTMMKSEGNHILFSFTLTQSTMLTHKVFTNSSTYFCTASTTEATTTETTPSTDTGKTITFMIDGHFSYIKFSDKA